MDTNKILTQELLDFLSEKDVSYKHFDVDRKSSSIYTDFLWDIINPKGNILNMGIMKKTPASLSKVVQLDSVTHITHIELDTKRKVHIGYKENVIWEKDFVKYVRVSKRKGRRFNGIVIWHGPEHLTKKDGLECIKNSLEIAKDWVVVSCPWDRLEGWKQQPKGKDHLGHKSVWTENDFLDLGFRVISFGERKVYPGYLVVWKIK